MRPGLVVCFVVAVCTTACVVTPDDRASADITEIDTPDSLAATDTVHVSFVYTFGGCERDGGVRTERRTGELTFANELTFAAFKIVPRLPEGANCPDVLRLVQFRHVIPPPQRAARLTLVFLQPSGNHSVRVVRTP
jgi:hypothetical protein